MAECPTCGDGFGTERGMKIHHSQAHDEPVGGEVNCAWCGELVDAPPSRVERAERLFCDQECKGAWDAENKTGDDHPLYESVKLSCDSCGSSFTRQPSKVKENNFCSNECRYKWLDEDNPRRGVEVSERITVSCDYCGEEEERTPSDVSELTFCDRECYSNWMSESDEWSTWVEEAIEVSCEWCGNTLKRPPCRVERAERQFCDNDCRGEWASENRVGEAHPNYNRVNVTCPICGDTIQARKSYAEKYNAITCSDSCWSELMSRRHSGRDPEKWATRECEVCGEEFDRLKSKLGGGSGRFCSHECHARFLSTQTGEDARAWQGGHPGSMGPNWPETREQIRKRDGYECQVCGVAEKEHKQRRGVELSVHHITPRREFRENGEIDWGKANAAKNLITLCIPCHMKWEGMPVFPGAEARAN
jgi:ribosomal protein L31